ncbi:carboxypeptidase regulatory-like domain-containing protein [Aeoliella sp.]|uniref:carboxypeptidase regulatory-like domain-containing protein n=1 Tax=Aeoliella sp. TaxID=2795800 RepID=UPI003CCC3E38
MRIKSLAATFVLLTIAAPSLALIMGSDGDEPVENAGWPVGADVAFNVRERVAYWEGPPFGGGQFHGEYRGDTAALNEVLDIFKDIRNDNKRIVVEDGVGHSFWLNPNREADKEKRARIDWQLMVWSEPNWKQLSGMRADLNPTDPADREIGPPTVLTIYTGGNIVWDQVKLPEGVKVVDSRLSAHGFTTDDGHVVEGQLTAKESGKPLAGQVDLVRYVAKKTGGYEYTTVKTVETDEAGKWVIKNTPEGSYQLVGRAEGYVPRIMGYARPSAQPRWQRLDSNLVEGGDVTGRVTTKSGDPLQDVHVRLSNVAVAEGESYRTAGKPETTTNESGEFRIANVPRGTASIYIHKDGYCRPGLGLDVTVPSEDVHLEMLRSSNITVIVLFESTEVPEQYMVAIEPEGGNKVGSWGGSARIDEKNQHVFKNVPPGRYKMWGHPNPHSEDEKSEPMLLDLKGGEEITKTIIVTE